MRRAREVSAAANKLMVQKDDLDAMSWDSVRKLSRQLVDAVDHGDREGAQQIAASLQSIADDNMRVLYRFNISDEDDAKARRLASGMRVLPSMDNVPSGAHSYGAPGVVGGKAASAAPAPVAGDEPLEPEVEPGEVETAASEPEESKTESVSETGQTDEELAPTDGAGYDVGVLLGVESVVDTSAPAPRELSPEAVELTERVRQREEAAAKAKSTAPEPSVPVQENQRFQEFLRVLNSPNPVVSKAGVNHLEEEGEAWNEWAPGSDRS